jgi:hypothetical protein
MDACMSIACFLINMPSLETSRSLFYKSDVLVLLVLPDKIGWSGLPNQTV